MPLHQQTKPTFFGKDVAVEKFRDIVMRNADGFLDPRIYPRPFARHRYTNELDSVTTRDESLVYNMEMHSFRSQADAVQAGTRLMTMLSAARIPYVVNETPGVTSANFASKIEFPELASICVPVTNWSRLNVQLKTMENELQKRTVKGAALAG